MTITIFNILSFFLGIIVGFFLGSTITLLYQSLISGKSEMETDEILRIFISLLFFSVFGMIALHSVFITSKPIANGWFVVAGAIVSAAFKIPFPFGGTKK